MRSSGRLLQYRRKSMSVNDLFKQWLCTSCSTKMAPRVDPFPAPFREQMFFCITLSHYGTLGLRRQRSRDWFGEGTVKEWLWRIGVALVLAGRKFAAQMSCQRSWKPSGCLWYGGLCDLTGLRKVYEFSDV